MRVLWFSNRTPSGAKDLKNDIGGSWIEALEQELHAYPIIDLGIVFKELTKTPNEIKSKSSRTRYFMVPRYPYGKFDRWVGRFIGRPPSRKPLRDYMRVVNNFRPDVILFFGTESDFPLIIPQLNVPSIIWFQGNLTVYERMYENGISVHKALYQNTLKDILMGDSILHDSIRFKNLVQREKQIFSYAKNFIGRTDWDRRLVNIMAPKANYFHCDEPMRRPFLENKWTQVQNRDKFVIVTTIQENLYKGLEMVFETSYLLTDRLEKQLEWRVVGISEGTAYVKAARKIANYPPSNSTVKLLGRKDGPELVQELLDADLYVHPSHIENSPNAVQEAMVLGMPVIATNVGGTPSLLIDGKEGILVQSKDPYALAGAILELYRLPDKAKTIGENARKLGLKRNDSKKICSELLDVFDQVAGHTI